MIKKKMQNSFIKLLSFFIVIVLVSTLLLFYSTMQYVLFNYIGQANEHLVNQVRSTFELVIGQVTNKAYKFGIYDNDLVTLVRDRNQGALHTMKLYEALNSIVIENEYLDSAYLYSEEENTVFDSKTGCSYRLEEFYDRAAAEKIRKHYFSRVDPHIIRRISGNMDLVYSIIVVLPEKTAGGNCTMLSINVDMNKVFQDIAKRNQMSADGKLFIYNEDNQIMVSADTINFGGSMDAITKNGTIDMKNASFWTILTQKSGVINAFSESDELGWKFCMQVPYEIDISSVINKYAAFLFVCLMLALALLVIYIVMRHTTKPLDTFLNNYDETVVKNLLTEPNFMKDKNTMELECLERLFHYDRFVILVIETEAAQGELFKILRAVIPEIASSHNRFFAEPVTLYHGRAAVLCNYSGASESSFAETAFPERLGVRLNENGMEKAYIAVSTVKEGYGELFLAVKECEEILEYKLSLPQRRLTYDSFIGLKGEIDYPSNCEKQLVNNLIAANLENCMFYLSKYMDHLFCNRSIISDLNIKNYVYQLQTELLKHISSLPLSIKTSNSLDLKSVRDKEYIYESLSELIHTICMEITKKNSNNESELVQSILEYIQNHLTDDDFNLNTVSYQFNMNRNYLARIIKESTSYAFNDYVNYRKIELAKEKMKDASRTIEQISNEVGFSYSHYFIKVFKSMEGITPGTYRKTVIHNNDAQEE